MKITNYNDSNQESEKNYIDMKGKYKFRAIITTGYFGSIYTEKKSILFCNKKFDYDKTMRNNNQIQSVNFYKN